MRYRARRECEVDCRRRSSVDGLVCGSAAGLTLARRPRPVPDPGVRDDAGPDDRDWPSFPTSRGFCADFPMWRRWRRPMSPTVLKAWEGLGYYRRARQLHAAAQMIVDEHGGTVPNDPAAVRALPGVGRYIAGAILSFAFDRPEPIVEANSQRVLARLLAIDGKPQDGRGRESYLESRRAAGAGRRGGDIQPGADGAWRPGLHATRAGLPGLSAGGDCARPAGWGCRTDCPSQLRNPGPWLSPKLVPSPSATAGY